MGATSRTLLGVVHLPQVVQLVINFSHTFFPIFVHLTTQRLVTDSLASKAYRGSAVACGVLLSKVVLVTQVFFVYHEGIGAIRGFAEAHVRSCIDVIFNIELFV
jgi:hypothetical protein